MTNLPWTVRAAFAVTAGGVLLSGCSSSGSDATPTAQVTVTETAPATPEPASPQSGGGSFALPAAPSGAKELNNKTTSSMVYGHYEISGTSPEAVVNDYESALKSAGYTITNAGGSGGGWGKWGGSGYGMDAENSGTFASVQAGGSSGGPTYFEVCVGADQSVVDECGNTSQNENSDSNSKGS